MLTDLKISFEYKGCKFIYIGGTNVKMIRDGETSYLPLRMPIEDIFSLKENINITLKELLSYLDVDSTVVKY